MNSDVGIFKATVLAVCAFTLAVLLLLGGWAGFKAVSRGQRLADARNKVKVSEIEIRNQGQRILVAKQQAEIRKQQAIGVRNAQDEIAKTLTPLYVQFEMVEALKDIAHSGNNSSVVYIPSGANGIPLISSADPNKVGQPHE